MKKTLNLVLALHHFKGQNVHILVTHFSSQTSGATMG